MRDDLIFHLVSAGDWKASQQSGLYIPVSLEEDGFIHCSNGRQIQEVANKYFNGEQELMLIVIDVTSLESDLKFETPVDSDEKYPHIHGPLNIDAVIDKIKLSPEEDGTFFIQFSSYE